MYLVHKSRSVNYKEHGWEGESARKMRGKHCKKDVPFIEKFQMNRNDCEILHRSNKKVRNS